MRKVRKASRRAPKVRGKAPRARGNAPKAGMRKAGSMVVAGRKAAAGKAQRPGRPKESEATGKSPDGRARLKSQVQAGHGSQKYGLCDQVWFRVS